VCLFSASGRAGIPIEGLKVYRVALLRRIVDGNN